MQHHTTVLEENRQVASVETCPVGRTSSVPGDGLYMSSSALALILPCFCHKFVGNKLALDRYGIHLHIHSNIPVPGGDHILFPFNIW